MSFPFFDLPILVQCKILKNYVSSVDKIHSLALIPQFSDLLEAKSSWILSKERLEFLKWIRLFKPGFYFYYRIPLSRFHISFDETNLKMSICFLTCHGRKNFFPGCHLEEKSYSQVLDYLTRLKKVLIPDENIITYHNEGVEFITIDHNSNTLYMYNNDYKIKKGKCLLDNRDQFIILCGKVTLLDRKFNKFAFSPYQWNYNSQKDEDCVYNIILTVKDTVEIEIKEDKKTIINFFQREEAKNFINI